MPFDGKFSVIGIAETNISSDQKYLYNIDEYNSFYSDKIPDKSKGTGVAIYVHNSFSSTFYSQVSTNLPHIERLFVQVTKGKETINVGVMYLPPNTKFADFLVEAKKLIKILPKGRTYLMDDFNLNLLKSSSPTQTY